MTNRVKLEIAERSPFAGGHQFGARACAWLSPIEGSAKRRFFAVLHQPPVDSPYAAVRAPIVGENSNER